jgi:DNA-binding NtrC family response regulator
MALLTGHLLVVDDDEDVIAAARLLLKRKVSMFSSITDPGRLPDFLAEHPVDVILLDMNFTLGENSGRAGLEWLAFIKKNYPGIVVILMTAFAGVELAVNAMKAGSTDFVIKPWSNEKLLGTLHAAFSLAQARHYNAQLNQQNCALRTSISTKPPVFIGETPVMRELQRKINRCAPTEANVLILGENGSGKELVAREIHHRSARADQVFMAIDMGAIPDNLFEAELFGYKKGAFTGAQENRSGRLLAANGGTLFLDEIGNLPMHLQVKLLRVLEQRQVTALGDEKPQALNVRVIAATNASPAQLTNEQQFRQDLLYRLNTVELILPPLRDRVEDIPLLLDYFLGVYAQKYQRKKPGITRAAMQAISLYNWPGNVRALSHAVERALVLSDKDLLDLDDFALGNSAIESSADTAFGLENLHLETLDLETLERTAVEAALKKHQGNISRAANELGLTRTALYRRMEKYAL